MRNLFYNLEHFLKYDITYFFKKLIGKEPVYDADEITSALSAEDIAEIEAATDDFLSRIPSLDPKRTALFSTFSDNSPISHFNESLYFRKIRHDCDVLLELGYDIFFVNYGNKYGMLAMQELLRMKKTNNRFKLYCGKVIGERKSLLRNGLQELMQVADCDEFYAPLYPQDFISHVAEGVSAISYDDGLLFFCGHAPKELYDYYTKS